MAIIETVHYPLAERAIELVLAATPVGPLAHAIDAYRQAVAVRVGTNAAHRSPPHCLLARSCADTTSSIVAYRRALDAAVLDEACRHDVRVSAMVTDDEWHGLEIDSPLFHSLGDAFATPAPTSRQHERVMRQVRLRLALAADFESADCEALTEFAHRIVDPTLAADWEIGLWRCRGDGWEAIWRARVG